MHITDCHVFCSSPSLCVPLFIVPTKRLRLPCVLFICECAFVYCANKETQTALCFVIYLTVCLCLSCQPAKKTHTTQCFLILQAALCFVIYLWVCLCLSCQQRDSDCHVFCSSSSQCVPLFIVPTKRLRLPHILLFITVCAFVYCAKKRDSDCPVFWCSSLCVPLFIVPAKRLRLPGVLLFMSECAFGYCANKETQTAPCFLLLHLCVCLCLSYQQRDSDCPVFCSSSSECVLLFIVHPTTTLRPSTNELLTKLKNILIFSTSKLTKTISPTVWLKLNIY